MFPVTVRGRVRRGHPDDGGQLLTRVKARDVRSKTRGARPGDAEKIYTALIDTGASISAIQKELAQERDFTVVAEYFADAAHGGKVTDVYELDVTLPRGLVFRGVHVAAIDGLKGMDFVIGMDIIKESRLLIRRRTGVFTMSFPRRFVAPRSLSSF
ncbi:MAG: retropepsin-like domain-containing protein [Alphaproteobacteria bacterium]|nr:retropepsin-like domain-containing protein [Alphaproteobacteria bacterium]